MLGSRFVRRALVGAAITAMGIAGGATAAGALLPDDAPDPMEIVGPLAGGLAGQLSNNDIAVSPDTDVTVCGIAVLDAVGNCGSAGSATDGGSGGGDQGSGGNDIAVTPDTDVTVCGIAVLDAVGNCGSAGSNGGSDDGNGNGGDGPGNDVTVDPVTDVDVCGIAVLGAVGSCPEAAGPEGPSDPTDPTDPTDPADPTDPGDNGDPDGNGNGTDNGGGETGNGLGRIPITPASFAGSPMSPVLGSMGQLPQTGLAALPMAAAAMMLVGLGTALADKRRSSKAKS